MTPTTAEETLQFTCTSCAAPMRVRASAVGKRAACPKCRTPNLVQRPPSPDDVACVHCGAFTNVDPALAGGVRCSGCMMPLPGRDVRKGSQAGFLDILPVGIAALLLAWSLASLGVLIPMALGKAVPWMPAHRAAIGVYILVNTILAGASGAFLLRVDTGRVILAWLLAAGAILGAIFSLAMFSPLGLVFAVLYGLAALLFFGSHGESYIAGGPPGPRVAMTLTTTALLVGIGFGLFSFTKGASRDDDADAVLKISERLRAARKLPIADRPAEVDRIERDLLHRLDGRLALQMGLLLDEARAGSGKADEAPIRRRIAAARADGDASLVKAAERVEKALDARPTSRP